MCCVLEKDNLPSGGVSLCLGKQMIAGKLLHQRYLTKFWKVEPAMGQHPIYRRRRRWGVTILVVALFQWKPHKIWHFRFLASKMSLPHHRYIVNTAHTKSINTTIANFVNTYQVFKTRYQFWFISILFTDWPITNDHQEGVSTMYGYQSVSANFIHGSIPRHISCIKLFLYLIVKIFSKVRSVHLLHVRSGEERCAKQT